jgi:hypothetical protein
MISDPRNSEGLRLPELMKQNYLLEKKMSETSVREKLFLIMSNLKNPKRDTEGYNYSYATLDQVMDLLKPFLKQHRLLLIQEPRSLEKKIGIITSIYNLDVENEAMHFEFYAPLIKEDIQSVGSMISYLRRYHLLSIFSLCPVDDDGDSAMPEPKMKFNETKNQVPNKWAPKRS